MPAHEVVPETPTEGQFASRFPAEAFNPLRRYVPLVAWLIVILTLITVPARIVDYGFLPADDALRHAAKVISGKPWSEILVLRSDFRMDPHPGWHAILGCVHRLSGWGTDGLVVFSIISLMLLMEPDDLAVYRRVQWNFGELAAYEPWIKKMGPNDRLVLRASWLSPGVPNLPELEWRYAVRDLWVGRLRQKPTPAAPHY